MARVIGDLIDSTHFNTVVDDFNVLWQDPKDGGGSVIVYTWDNTLHTTDLDRRKGWGNADMSSGATVSAGTIVLANHYNILASYVNTAEYHRVDASYSPTTHVATGQDVLAADLDPLVNVINGYTVTPTGTAFDLGADATLTPQAVSISNGGTPWGTNDLASAGTRGTLTCELTYTWANYTDARHFFNSGGKCILDLEAVGGTNGATEWDIAFDQIDSIYFGAKTTYRGGTNGVGAKSFYELTNAYQQIFNAVGFDTSLYGGAYTGYSGGYSTYGGREVTVNAKVGMSGTDFVVTFQVILTEDPDDEFQVDADITLYGGHKYAAVSPNASYMATSSGNKHKVGGVSYLFEDKSAKAPAVAQLSAWTYAP